jgi:hypothetical protein
MTYVLNDFSYFLTKHNLDLANTIIEMTNLINEICHVTLKLPNEKVFFFEDDDRLFDEDDGYYTINKSNPSLASNERFVELATKLGCIELIDRRGGGEGGGELVYRVYYFQNWDLYLSFEGWYASSYGKEFEECRKVKPKVIQAYDWISA